jgi:fido (protein-threonine AMPylation protein)
MTAKQLEIEGGVGFTFLGGVISWAVTHWYYRRQKRESAKDSRDLTIFFYNVLQQGGRLEEILRIVDEKVTNLHGHSVKDIEREFYLYNTRLVEKRIGEDRDAYLTTALTWKALADTIAEDRVGSLDFHILDANGSITSSALLRAHKEMFPSEYRWAGTWRDAFVSIQRAFTPLTESRLAAMSSMRITPIAPDRIVEELNRLLDRWNRNVADHKKSEIRSVAIALANFHQQFQLIHPFFDGNGRLGRAILREQVKFLTGYDLKQFTDQEAYLQALQASDAGETDALARYIESHIQRP